MCEAIGHTRCTDPTSVQITKQNGKTHINLLLSTKQVSSIIEGSSQTYLLSLLYSFIHIHIHIIEVNVIKELLFL